MGVYENKYKSDSIKWANGATTHWEMSDPGYGQKRRRLIISHPWQLEPRETCYCCTCPEFGNMDSYCRNHGWEGTRECKVHNMPGDVEDG